MNRRDLSNAAVAKLDELVSEYERSAGTMVRMLHPETAVEDVVASLRTMGHLVSQMADALEKDQKR